MGLGHFYFVVIGEGQKISDESRRGGSENFFDGSWGVIYFGSSIFSESLGIMGHVKNKVICGSYKDLRNVQPFSP